MNDNEKFENAVNNIIDDLSGIKDLFDWLTEKPKIFYRKFRCGKKLYKTRKMFQYNPIKNDLIIPTTLFAIKTIRRRLNEENTKF